MSCCGKKRIEPTAGELKHELYAAAVEAERTVKQAAKSDEDTTHADSSEAKKQENSDLWDMSSWLSSIVSTRARQGLDEQSSSRGVLDILTETLLEPLVKKPGFTEWCRSDREKSQAQLAFARALGRRASKEALLGLLQRSKFLDSLAQELWERCRELDQARRLDDQWPPPTNLDTQAWKSKAVDPTLVYLQLAVHNQST